MKKPKYAGLVLAGLGAGAVNGLFGAGGGMVLVPLLSLLTDLEDQEVFSSSIAIILPICLVSLTVSGLQSGIPWSAALPWLLGSAAGGVLAGFLGQKIPTVWLHQGLGILIVWGGLRYLCWKPGL
ncbi:MAG: sulfite exporter TauE/SafE family protein [Oscillospiraceae bacterium]|nr:sulfite exporter TauE/SafE family protein [Oscillospiraceae bacterium]